VVVAPELAKFDQAGKKTVGFRVRFQWFSFLFKDVLFCFY
jgi:hypothetical protein